MRDQRTMEIKKKEMEVWKKIKKLKKEAEKKRK
jgi:hypothetical protein